MQSRAHLTGLWQSTWDSSQFYLGQVGSLREVYGISLNDLRAQDAKTVFFDTLVFPGYATGASLLVLFVQLITRPNLVRGLYHKLTASEEGLNCETEDEDAEEVIPERQRSSVVTRHIAQYGSVVIFAYRILRLLCTLALLALTIATIVLTAQRGSVSTVTTALPQVALCLTYWTHRSLVGVCSAYVLPRETRR
ncbi:hypothetical protein DAEQUDRAFT_568286 [Daedalea quercina L-15889]|uniref:Uncharacterized protein n=1 Tax=Daedalea quercina L-15889 TaxID=1314783 RepID=A0A165LYF0_9APHY|nr:hypothetical protein DAEQUDRAFT_568286 [Daedalea quercina L-15889]